MLEDAVGGSEPQGARQLRLRGGAAVLRDMVADDFEDLCLAGGKEGFHGW